MKWPWTKPVPEKPLPSLHTVLRCKMCGHLPMRDRDNKTIFLMETWWGTIRRRCPKCQFTWLELPWSASVIAATPTQLES